MEFIRFSFANLGYFLAACGLTSFLLSPPVLTFGARLKGAYCAAGFRRDEAVGSLFICPIELSRLILLLSYYVLQISRPGRLV